MPITAIAIGHRIHLPPIPLDLVVVVVEQEQDQDQDQVEVDQEIKSHQAALNNLNFKTFVY